MYELFRGGVLYHLSDLSPEILSRVAEAMDVVSAGYSIKKAETGLSVIGREKFLEIAATYVIVRKTEGIKSGTTEHMVRILKQFIQATPKPIAEVKPNDIRAFLYNYQKARGISNRTLDMMRTIICTFFKWAASEGYIPTDPSFNIRPIKYTRKPRKALSQRELELVRRACTNDRDRAIIETLYSTGCRVTELCNIRLGDVNWSKHEILVLGKGSKYRTVYLNAKAEVALEVYLNGRKHNSEYLFCNIRGGGQMTPCNVERIFAVIEEKTHVIVTPHIMRHTFATQALTGTGVEVVQKMLGHSNIATTMVYAEVDQSLIHAAHTRSVV